MIGQAKIEERPAQPYMGIRAPARMDEFPTIIPQRIDALFGWLAEQGIAPAGAPIMRYHVINMAGEMDIELGVPVAQPHPGTDRIRPNTLPAGRYAALIYRGVQNGYPANAALLEWGQQQGLTWDRWDAPNGDAFGSRYETFISGPEDDPDPANWDNEVAIRLAD
jgi:effector-binding domain-containing protein